MLGDLDTAYAAADGVLEEPGEHQPGEDTRPAAVGPGRAGGAESHEPVVSPAAAEAQDTLGRTSKDLPVNELQCCTSLESKQ